MKTILLFALVALSHATYAADNVPAAVPFATGDILVSASLMDDADDDHKGTGRILQFDSNLQLKGAIYTDATDHQIGSLVFAPDGTLWALSPMSWDIIEIAQDATERPARNIADRSFGSLVFAEDGSLYFGEHLQGTKDSTPMNQTRFKYLEGRDVIGDGHIFHYSADGQLIKEYANDTHGGMVGIHGVNSMVLTDNGQRMIYISETGNRVMQYDLANDRQLPDLINGDTEAAPAMLLYITQMPDKRLIISTGRSLLVVDENSGSILKTIEMENSGWAAISPGIDAPFLLAGNFFTGEFVKLNIDTGEVVARGDIGVANSLSGIAQYPGK